MALAFWRDKSAANDKRKSSARTRSDAGAENGDPATALKVRARRRLIGAAALLLAAIIVVPLLLDPAPRPPADNIPIDIPSEKQPFTPRLSLPPVPDPGQTPLAPPLDPAPEADKPKSDSPKGEGAKGEGAAKGDSAVKGDGPAKTEPVPKTDAPKAPRPQAEPKASPKEAPAKQAEPKARPAAESKIVEPKAVETAARGKPGRLVLQAAALSTDAAAHDLSERLRKAGFAPFTEKVETADGVRFRVRIGPYATRDEAQRAQSKLRALGVAATLVTT